MRIRFTDHARRRMQQRKVSEVEVIDCVEGPDELRTGDFGETIAIKSYGNVYLQVVYEEEESGAYVIITVIRSKLRLF